MKVVKVHRYILQLVQSPLADTGGYTRLCRCLITSGTYRYNAFSEAMHGDPTRHVQQRAADPKYGRVVRTISLGGRRRVCTSASVLFHHCEMSVKAGGDGPQGFDENRVTTAHADSAAAIESENNQSLSTGAGGLAYPPASEPKKDVHNTRRRVRMLDVVHGGPAGWKAGSVSTGRVTNLSGLTYVLSDKECCLNITRKRREVS